MEQTSSWRYATDSRNWSAWLCYGFKFLRSFISVFCVQTRKSEVASAACILSLVCACNVQDSSETVVDINSLPSKDNELIFLYYVRGFVFASLISQQSNLTRLPTHTRGINNLCVFPSFILLNNVSMDVQWQVVCPSGRSSPSSQARGKLCI